MEANAAILDQARGTFTVDSAPVPEPAAGEVLLRQRLCGVCGTDVHMYQGHFPFTQFPLVLGHEILGEVVALGEGVSADVLGEPVAAGDHVAVVPGVTCGSCYYCSVLREPGLCLNGVGYGFKPYPEEQPHFQGGFSQYVLLKHPRSQFLKMKASPEVAVLLEPLSVGVHFAERARLDSGSTVVVQGAGAIGIFSLVAARESGAHRVIVVGAPASRLELAKAFGADEVISIEQVPDPEERIRVVREQTPGGLGADCVFECAGVPAAIPEGIQMLRRGGTYVEGGHFTDVGDVAINPFSHLVLAHIELVGVWGSSLRHFVRGRTILESGRYPFDEMVSHTLTLERLGEAMQALSTDYRLDGVEARKIAIAAGS